MAYSVESRLRSLASMARALGRSERLEVILELCAEEARQVIDAASVSISRLEAGTGLIRTVINVGDLGPHEQRWPVDEVYHLQDFTQLRSVVESLRTWTYALDGPDIDPKEAELLRTLDKASALGAPLVVDGALWGELYATRGHGQVSFDGGETAYIEVLAAILSGAISRALHVQSLEEMAFHDPLTGLANRRWVDDAVNQALDELSKHGTQDVCVVLADANGLKAVNDTQGHAEGDRFLRLVARTLVQQFAKLPGSLVARVGGDEFCVVVVGHSPDVVTTMASKAVRATYRLDVGQGIACGLASADGSVQGRRISTTELFQAADRAQYAAKRVGARHAVVAGAAAIRSA